MTKQARTLDIITCGFTPANGINPDRIHYGFPVGPDRLYFADIYPEGNFDLGTIEIGKRYVVQTKQLRCLAWDRKAQQYTYQDKFVWVKATEVMPGVKLAARTGKQRKRSEALAAAPVVDDGSLFTW
jgi:hypothetical protein